MAKAFRSASRNSVDFIAQHGIELLLFPFHQHADAWLGAVVALRRQFLAQQGQCLRYITVAHYRLAQVCDLSLPSAMALSPAPKKYQAHAWLRAAAREACIFNHPNFGNPNSMLTSPLFGHSTQTLASSLGSGCANGGFNPLYQIGGPRSIQLALKLQF